MGGTHIQSVWFLPQCLERLALEDPQHVFKPLSSTVVCSPVDTSPPVAFDS